MTECEANSTDPVIREVVDQYDTLQKIVDELKLGGYGNDAGYLVCDPAFLKLEQLANAEQKAQAPVMPREPGYEEQPQGDGPFHIEADIYDSGDYANLLVIPAAGTYIVVGSNEHLATLVQTCSEPECWEQIEGGLDDEVVEKLGREISYYVDAN